MQKVVGISEDCGVDDIVPCLVLSCAGIFKQIFIFFKLKNMAVEL